MAGGTGSRLWPTSRSSLPKQFWRLLGEKTLLQETRLRLEGLGLSSSVTVCNTEHRFIVAQQLRDIDIKDEIILEPVGRNTAATIGVAALSDADDPLVLVVASDHVIEDQAEFFNSVELAVPLALDGRLVTFGVEPTEANTGFGYIRKGAPCDTGFLIEEFVEKPSLQLAESYLDSKAYLWNSGIFLFKASRYLQELEKYRPDIYSSCVDAVKKARSEHDFLWIDEKAFTDCPSESIDFAVMEKTRHGVVVPMKAGWSDIGSWKSLWEISEKDRSGNVSSGDTVILNSKNTLIRSPEKLSVILGVDDLIIVDTKDALLVAHKESSQDVKTVVERLRETDRSQASVHREVLRPWGKYDAIHTAAGYQVKKITVDPGGQLSMQMHHHRAEHWVVVSGEAVVHYEGDERRLGVNESTYHASGVIHSLENRGTEVLELIEVQIGPYLGEDDIVRFSDIYGRASPKKNN